MWFKKKKKSPVAYFAAAPIKASGKSYIADYLSQVAVNSSILSGEGTDASPVDINIKALSQSLISKDSDNQLVQGTDGLLKIKGGTLSVGSDGLLKGKITPPKPAGITLNRYDGQDMTMLVSFTVDGDDDMFFRVNFTYGNGFVLDGQLVGGGSYSINGNNFPPQTGISSATPAIYVFSGLSSGINMYVAQNGSSVWASQGIDVMFGFGDNANPSGTDNLIVG